MDNDRCMYVTQCKTFFVIDNFVCTKKKIHSTNATAMMGNFNKIE